jgi:hypothetical protein
MLLHRFKLIPSYFQNATMTEIETRLYDKLNITITDFKALLADSGRPHHLLVEEIDLSLLYSKYKAKPTRPMRTPLWCCGWYACDAGDPRLMPIP